MGRILIVDGDPCRRSGLRSAMESEGHLVAEVVDTDNLPERCRSGEWDLLIMDIGAEGCARCRLIRGMSEVGILVLMRDGSSQSRIDVLNAGADDYLCESFVSAELHARVRAILRRIGSRGETQRQVLLEDRAIDLGSHKIKGPGNRSTHLTPKEYLVLKCLMARADEPVHHRDLAQTLGQRDGSGDIENVRTLIGQLRRKIEPDYNSPRYILTERLVGYRFAAAADKSDSQAMAR